VLVESALDGVVIAGREIREDAVAAIAEVEAWTRVLAGPAGRPRVPLQTFWAPALERIVGQLGPGTPSDATGIAALAERTERILGVFDHVAVPAVLEHGDLAPPNLLRLRDGRLGVVDWEVADLEGLPLGDLLFFADFVAGHVSEGNTRLGPTGLPPALAASIERQAAYLDIDLTLLPALRLAMWARWADRQLARFVDRAMPLEDRLPARHVESWAETVATLEAPR
jgi:aminoglycoside phosphotransferase (APT) family kinase protein